MSNSAASSCTPASLEGVQNIQQMIPSFNSEEDSDSQVMEDKVTASKIVGDHTEQNMAIEVEHVFNSISGKYLVEISKSGDHEGVEDSICMLSSP